MKEHDRSDRRRRVRRLDRAPPAASGPSGHADRRLGPGAQPRLLGRRIAASRAPPTARTRSTREWRRSSLPQWKALSAVSGLPILHPRAASCSSFRPRSRTSTTASPRTGSSAFRPTCSTQAEMARRFPMIDFDGIRIGLFEPEFGALMARRSVQTLGRPLRAATAAPISKGAVAAARAGTAGDLDDIAPLLGRANRAPTASSSRSDRGCPSCSPT